MKLVVKNMVCDRCKAAVARVLQEVGLRPVAVELGEVLLAERPDEAHLDRLRTGLREAGFALVDGQEAILIERIKATIVQLVHHDGAAQGRVKLSERLAGELHREYSGLSALFSQVEGITIEHYFLLQRLERVKELIGYGELNLSEIATHTGFSSGAHLSAQFKQLTGMTPTAFRSTHGRRTPLDQVGS